MPTSASRLLLLLPTTTYRTEAFVAAATRMGVELVCASERPSTLQEHAPDNLVTLDFNDASASAEANVNRVPQIVITSLASAVDNRPRLLAAAIAASRNSRIVW